MSRRIVFDTETVTAGRVIWNFAAMEDNTDTGERTLLANLVNKSYFDHSAMSGAMFAPNEEKRLIVQNAEFVGVSSFMHRIGLIIEYANDNKIPMGAYNVPFDVRAIAATAEFYDRNHFPTINTTFDLYRDFVASVPLEYFLWTLATKRITEKGNPRMNAESAYAFITRTDFVESHTALEDVQAEIEIMHWLDKRADHRTENITYQSWYRSVLTANAAEETDD